MAYTELQQKIQLKYGFEAAILASQHRSFAVIVTQALGGKPKHGPAGKDPTARDVTAGAATIEDAALAINRMLSF